MKIVTWAKCCAIRCKRHRAYCVQDNKVQNKWFELGFERIEKFINRKTDVCKWKSVGGKTCHFNPNQRWNQKTVDFSIRKPNERTNKWQKKKKYHWQNIDAHIVYICIKMLPLHRKTKHPNVYARAHTFPSTVCRIKELLDQNKDNSRHNITHRAHKWKERNASKTGEQAKGEDRMNDGMMEWNIYILTSVRICMVML